MMALSAARAVAVRSVARPASRLARSHVARATVVARRSAPVSVRCGAASFSSGPQLTHDSLNADLRRAEYAVRGAIVIRAMELGAKLRAGEKLPFDSLVYCNIGNPQSLQQKPLSFNRSVMALMEYPQLLELEGDMPTGPDGAPLFEADAIERAKQLMSSIPGGVGAYSESQGVLAVRESIAKFISERDGHASDPADIFVTDGASPAVQMLIRGMIRSPRDAFMIPIPQYPLYSASIALYGGTQVGYELDEANAWGMPVETLRAKLANARSYGINVRGLAVINPGNPTGNCLSYDNIAEIINFCKDERLVLMADEVYQTNTWKDDRPFVSFKKVASDIGALDGDSTLQLASFHSVSKGFLGECGKRGGYVELRGFEKAVKDELYKLASISLCSNVAGQVMMELMVNPPKAGQPSFPKYEQERDAILSSLRRRAEKLVAALNKLEGVSCLPAQGAMYVFPQITLSPKVVAAAKEAGLAPDAFYCLQLLEEKGIVVVPGSGFGQVEGTWHFRSTFLPPEADMDSVIERLSSFHSAFLAKYQ